MVSFKRNRSKTTIWKGRLHISEVMVINMQMKRLTAGILSVLLLLPLLFVMSGCSGKGQEQTDDKTVGQDTLRVVFYKIGKADAALISGKKEDGTAFFVLIDTGEADDAPELLDKLNDAGVRRLDCLILTHYDKDHIGGFPKLLEQIQADRILMPDYRGEGEPYELMCAALETYTGSKEILTADTVFSLGEAAFAVSVPKAPLYPKKQDNNSSLVVTVAFGSDTLLFAGDAEAARQAELIDAGLGAVTLLKVPHHGVWNDGLDAFFAACQPEYAVITCSDKNPADEETLAALDNLNTVVYETRNGDITAVFGSGSAVLTQ